MIGILTGGDLISLDWCCCNGRCLGIKHTWLLCIFMIGILTGCQNRMLSIKEIRSIVIVLCISIRILQGILGFSVNLGIHHCIRLGIHHWEQISNPMSKCWAIHERWFSVRRYHGHVRGHIPINGLLRFLLHKLLEVVAFKDLEPHDIVFHCEIAHIKSKVVQDIVLCVELHPRWFLTEADFA